MGCVFCSAIWVAIFSCAGGVQGVCRGAGGMVCRGGQGERGQVVNYPDRHPQLLRPRVPVWTCGLAFKSDAFTFHTLCFLYNLVLNMAATLSRLRPLLD